MTNSTVAERREQAARLPARVHATRDKVERTDYTVPEVAEMLGVSANLVYQAVKTGELGHFKIGRKIRVTPDHLAEFRAGIPRGA